jgi:beta-lactamase regulating signal transducer with metallopeptidase domain
LEILIRIFWKYFDISIGMTAIIISLLLLSNIHIKKYSAKFRYYMWIPIIIALVMPINLKMDKIFIKPQRVLEEQLSQEDIHKESIQQQNIVKPKDIDNSADDSTHKMHQYDGETKQMIKADRWKPIKEKKVMDPGLLIIVWPLIAGLYILYSIFKYILFLKKLRSWSVDIKDNNIIHIFNQLKADMDISSNISLKRCSLISSPLIIGFLKPTLFISKKEYTSEELRFIFKHELTHYKRKDVYYKLILFIVSAIHWYNPVVHIMCRYISTECEASCDEQVVFNQCKKVKESYGRFIINEISYAKDTETIFGHYFYGEKKELKRRLKTIMNKEKKKKGIVATMTISVVVVLLLVLSSSAGVFPNDKKAINNIKEIKNSKDIHKSINAKTYNISEEVGDFSPLYMYDGDTYIAFSSYTEGHGYLPKVMKYTDEQWETIGNFDFEKEPVESISLFVDKGNLYVSYSVWHNQETVLKVMKYNSDKWEALGKEWITKEFNHSLYVYDGIPYIDEYDHETKELTVRMFSENKWQKVGNKNVSTEECDTHSLVVDNGIPYIVYSVPYSGDMDAKDKRGKIAVKRFNGTDWEDLGANLNNVQNSYNKISLFFEDHIPYIAYVEESNDSDESNMRAVVMKYDGKLWNEIGYLEDIDGLQNVYLAIQKGTPYMAYDYTVDESYMPQMGLARFEDGKAEILVKSIKAEDEKRTLGNVEIYMQNNEIYIAYQNSFPYENHPEKEFDMHGRDLMIKKFVIDNSKEN